MDQDRPDKRMLMLSPAYPWPSNTGALIRIRAILEGLSKFFSITFVAPVGQSDDGVYLKKNHRVDARVIPVPVSLSRASHYGRILSGVLSQRPLHCGIYAYAKMSRAVAEELKRKSYDLVYCHFMYPLQYLPPVTEALIILDPQNVDRQYWQRKAAQSRGWKRLVSLWNLRRVERYEVTYLSHVWALVSVSENDRELTMSYAGDTVANYLLAPNGVDTTHYSPIDWTQRPERPVTLAFLGSLDLDTNVAAAKHLCQELFPRLCAELPQVPLKLLLIGRNPRRSLRNIARRESNIALTGTVPDVQPWLKQSDILVLPLREGAGTKLRVLEAMACALPGVGTEFALQGLGGEDGIHFHRARDDTSLVHAVRDLVLAPQKRAETGHNARRLVESQFDWKMITEHLAEDIHRSL